MISCLLPHYFFEFGPKSIFACAFRQKMHAKRKVPILSAKEVPALANVRALVSPAQPNIFCRDLQGERGASRSEIMEINLRFEFLLPPKLRVGAWIRGTSRARAMLRIRARRRESSRRLAAAHDACASCPPSRGTIAP